MNYYVRKKFKKAYGEDDSGPLGDVIKYEAIGNKRYIELSTAKDKDYYAVTVVEEDSNGIVNKRLDLLESFTSREEAESYISKLSKEVV